MTAQHATPRRGSARRRPMALLAAAGLAGVAVTAGGCVQVTGVTLGQQDLMGAGDIQVKACVSKQNSINCPSVGTNNIKPSPVAGARWQALVGLEVPDEIILPQSVPEPARVQGWWGGTYTQSPEYTAALTGLHPPDAGRHWVGYLSEPQADFTPGMTARAFTSFAFRPAVDGTPMPSTFTVRTVVGAREVITGMPPVGDFPADRPVVCEGTQLTVCEDMFLTSVSSPTLHDLAIPRPATVTAVRGTTAVVPVTLNFSGQAAPEYAFALTATTTLPGTSATVNVPTLSPPTDSTTNVSVSVPVPADAAPGTYAVSLTAKIGSTGESRSAAGTLVVRAPAGVPAGGGVRRAVTLGVARGVTARTARSKGLPIVISSDTAGSARVTLTQIRRVRVGPRRFASLPVQIVRRNVAVRSGVTRLRIRGAGLRPGRVTVAVAGTGFSVRGATLLR